MWLKKNFVQKIVSTSRFCAKMVSATSDLRDSMLYTQAVQKHYTVKHLLTHVENINQAFILLWIIIILGDICY